MSASAALDSPLALVRLLQLASPMLPIGAYSYSQGLEWVISVGDVADVASVREWIGGALELVLAPGEAAVAWRAVTAAQAEDWRKVVEWNDWFRASRETAELRAETAQMGTSLSSLALELDLLDPAARGTVKAMGLVTLPAAYALVARGFGIPAEAALTAYVWAWLENQVLAAMKTIPLGQVAGQRLLAELAARIPSATATARSIDDEDVSSFGPGLALASSRHETQYSRLFRS